MSPSSLPRLSRRILAGAVAALSMTALSTMIAPQALAQDTPAQDAAVTSVLPPETLVQELDNGLTVVVVPLPGSGIVAVQTWMDVGSRDELIPGTTGYAHFFEHLMFHGSRQLPGDERERALMALGVNENAWTAEDHTVYVSQAPADKLARLLSIEADRFKALHLVEDEVRREAGAVQGEHRKGQASPWEAAWTALFGAAFRVHPYHHPVIGLDEDVAAMTDGFQQVSAFFDRYYRPERATLVIAGDVAPGQALAAVQDSHGDWDPDTPAPPRPELPQEPAQDGLRRVHVPWTSGPVSPRVAMGWKLPAYDPGDTTGAALILAAELLGSEVSPLHRRLVEEEELVTELWVAEPDWRSPGLLVIMADLREGADLDRVEAIIRQEAAALSDPGRDLADRVAAARRRARRARLLALDSPAAWAGAVGDIMAFDGDPRDLDRHVAGLASVTAPQLRRAANRWLVDDQLTVAFLAQPDQLQDAAPPTELPPLGGPPDDPADDTDQDADSQPAQEAP